MSLVGIDLNATRLRAVSGPRPEAAALVRLEGDAFDLPLALSLETRRPMVGKPGASLSRRLPHLACLDFLPYIGQEKTWVAGRHKLDAVAALGLVFDALTRPLGSATGVVLAVPPYLQPPQIARLRPLAEKSRWRLTGTLPAPLAAVLAAVAADPTPTQWNGLVVVADVDGYALTWSAVEISSGVARLLHTHAIPHLNRGAWLRRLLDGVSHRLVRLTRRDPRESGEAEQALYDRLGLLLEVDPIRSLVELEVGAGSWYQGLMLQADELAAFTLPLVHHTLSELEAFAAGVASWRAEGPAAVVLTPAAQRLPGLSATLEAWLDQVSRPPEVSETDDYGAALMDRPTGAAVMRRLGIDAIARAAHEVAVRVHSGELPPHHLESIPLAPGQGPGLETGPARLHFQGRDHILSGASFTLGRDPACDLVFASELYPTVSARHCDISFDHRAYTLTDRSRHGTLLNDQQVRRPAALHAGDWIRLGPSGPTLRFLGRASTRTQMTTS